MLATCLVSALFAGLSAQAESTVDALATEYELFPKEELFDSLLADPRWPRFSGAHEWRLGTDEFNRVASVSFGETFTFARSPEYDWGQWDIGIQAMVDAILDMTSQSFDLANEDYFVGIAATLVHKDVSTQFRISHTSSHLGDEYLLENAIPRISVSYEIIDVLVSYNPAESFRVYGGGGVYLNPSPAYDPLLMQLGFEWTSPVRFLGDVMTPVFGTDVQLRQQNDFIPEVSVLAALRFAKPENDRQHIEVFARFYHGRSPDGQFFKQTVDIMGIGFRLGF
jgi:hypothetical protein